MNSVALPASASTQVLSAEADLVRQAARGDAEAFGELFRRHSAPAWRLAQAVSTDQEGATAAFREGFVRAVKSGRMARRSTDAFRPQVLSSVYRAAIDQAYDRTAAPAPARRPAADSPEAALAAAAFRSLPERWRAALWLSEVENLESDRIAGVLGVSASVAEQLVARGRRGLAGRFAQAHREMPEHVGEVLRPLALAAPANLADVTRSSWSTAGGDRLPLMAPVAGWLEDRAIRPMSVAAGALIGLGLIGLGVVPGGAAVRSPLGAAGASGSNSALGVQSCLDVSCPAGSNGAGTANGSGLLSPSYLSTSFTSGSGSASGAGGGAGAGFGSGSGTGGTILTGGSGPSGTGSGSGTGAGTGSGSPTGSGPGSYTPPPPTPSPPPGGGSTTLVTLPANLGSVGTSGSNLTTNLGGSGGVTLNTGTSGISGSVAGTPLPTNSLTGTGTSSTGSGTSTSGSTTTTTTPIQSVTSTVGGAVTGAVNNVTSTVTTLLPGL